MNMLVYDVMVKIGLEIETSTLFTRVLAFAHFIILELQNRNAK